MEAFALLGKIYASFNPIKTAKGMVVSDGKVVFLGDEESAIKKAKELGGEIIDRRGKIVLPGFIDSHMHLNSLGISLMTLDLRGTKSISELKGKLSSFRKGGEKVIIGRGWDQELFSEGRWPRASDLDAVISDIPVVLVRVCGHAAVLNSLALEIALEEGMEDYIQRDDKGEPTGVIFEDLVGIVLTRMTEWMDKHEIMMKATMEAARLGVTSVGFMSAKIKDLEILKMMNERNELRTRVFVYLDYKEIDALKQVNGSIDHELLRVNGIKLFADGSLGARTALLSQPYADSPETSGVAVMGENELAYWSNRAKELGLQSAIHAIGDAALDNVIGAFKKSGIRGNLGRVEHASIVMDDQIQKLASLGIGASVQPHFIISDWWLVKRLGMERAKYAYRFKTMMKAGIDIGFSTDSPVEPLDPWITLDAAVNRGEKEGVELFNLTRDERLSIEEALHAYTAGSAKLMRAEGIGRLEPGNFADFVIVSGDPFNEDLASLRVLESYIGGKRVHPI
ncbi:MAG: amidohydrolase [Fervidicoccaceae archaeon]